MSQIQLFLQFEGSRRIELIELDSEALGEAILSAAISAGLSEKHREGAQVFGPEHDEPLIRGESLSKQGIRHKHRVHVHRCHRVEVTVHFNDLTKVIHLPPSATIDRVKNRFVHEIRMSPVDATEHVLQICGSTDRPEPDIQIGSLVSDCCSVCFDFVPVKRVEG